MATPYVSRQGKRAARRADRCAGRGGWKKRTPSCNGLLRHEVARLIVWHAVVTRMGVEGSALLPLSSRFHSSSPPHRTSTFQRIRRSNSGCILHFRIHTLPSVHDSLLLSVQRSN